MLDWKLLAGAAGIVAAVVFVIWLIFFCALCLCLFGCAAQSGGGDKPALPQPESTPSRTQGTSAAQLVPERLSKNESGVPMLRVYDVKSETLETLSVEDYLPAVLAAAAVVFLLSARGLPARDAVTADFGGIFRFDGQLTLTAAVLGGFLLLAAAALRLVSGGMAGLELILSVFLACSGAALLYALIAQRRSGAFAPTALLVPVCFLVVQLIVTYRANARDSVLGHFYVELLLLAALCLASLYLAAFAYRCGAPRSFAPAAHLALTLAAACCVDMALARRLDGLAACLGAALLLLAYLEAAGDFEG